MIPDTGLLSEKRTAVEFVTLAVILFLPFFKYFVMSALKGGALYKSARFRLPKEQAFREFP